MGNGPQPWSALSIYDDSYRLIGCIAAVNWSATSNCTSTGQHCPLGSVAAWANMIIGTTLTIERRPVTRTRAAPVPVGARLICAGSWEFQYVAINDVTWLPPPVSCSVNGPTILTHPVGEVGKRIKSVSQPWEIKCSGGETLVKLSTAGRPTLSNGTGRTLESTLSFGRDGVSKTSIVVRGSTNVDVISTVTDTPNAPGAYSGSSVILAEWD